MFNLLRRLFEKKQEDVVIKEKELLSWFDTETTQLNKALDEDLDRIKANISAEIKKAHENIEKLNNTILQNKDIKTREMQFMEGNREAYTKRVTIFLNQINVLYENMSLQDMENIDIAAGLDYS